jgi:hypothetical protein
MPAMRDGSNHSVSTLHNRCILAQILEYQSRAVGSAGWDSPVRIFLVSAGLILRTYIAH